MNNVNSNLISNLVSSLVIDKFSLDNRYSLVITTMISSLLISANSNMVHTIYSNIRTLHLSVYLSIIMVWGLVYMYYTKKPDNDTHTSFKTYSCVDCKVLRFMMTTHPEFFDTEYDVVTGNPEFLDLRDMCIPQENVKVRFNDTIHNVSGYITMDFSEITKTGIDNKSVQQKAYYITLHLLKGCGISGDRYIEKLCKYRNECREKSNKLQLFMVKTMGKTDNNGKHMENYQHEIKIYEGPRDNWEDRYEKYMLSYFSPNRDHLWNYFHNIHFHPEKFSKFGQEARCNMLIHGPPGTGKSSFAYRLAMSLGRHIMSIDITAISHDRTEVYKSIQSPFIDETDQWYKPEDCIILLEEFDITVNYLKNKDSLKYVVKQNDEDGPTKITRSTREFELEDLLEILQGPVPIKGQIIIATTNKYKEISELCPALFRPGRLTPVEFGYMDWNCLQQMTKHYFNNELTIKEQKITVPTSEIVELALASSLYDDDGFKRFQEGMQQILDR